MGSNIKQNRRDNLKSDDSDTKFYRGHEEPQSLWFYHEIATKFHSFFKKL